MTTRWWSSPPLYVRYIRTAHISCNRNNNKALPLIHSLCVCRWYLSAVTVSHLHADVAFSTDTHTHESKKKRKKIEERIRSCYIDCHERLSYLESIASRVKLQKKADELRDPQSFLALHMHLLLSYIYKYIAQIYWYMAAENIEEKLWGFVKCL